MINHPKVPEIVQKPNRCSAPYSEYYDDQDSIDTDKTCHNAVSRIIAWLAGEGLEIPSEDNSGYCQARKRLSEKILQKLFIKVGNKLELIYYS